MDAQQALLTVPVARPLAAPVTMAPTARLRRNSGRRRVTREASVWGATPDMLMPSRAKARSLL